MAIEASAPVRICDIGGWTDTWFGGPGRVFQIAVAPGVTVTVRPSSGRDPVVLDVVDFADRYPIVPGARRTPRHPLLEAAVDRLAPPPGVRVEVCVRAAVPPGSGTGTSAAVAVALLGALAALRGEHPAPLALAYDAHRLETEVLGGESGIQDQLSAALGGVNYLEIDRYPEATVVPLAAPEGLGARLTLVTLGRAHDSSALHRRVIEAAGRDGPGRFSALRRAAVAARDAVGAGDLVALGRAMTAGTDAQRELLDELVGDDARRVIGLARSVGALGWKVNGAGGDGGSVTVLSADPDAAAALARAVEAADPRHRARPVSVSPTGLVVRGSW